MQCLQSKRQLRLKVQNALLSGQAIRFASGFQHPETLMKRGTYPKLLKEMNQQ